MDHAELLLASASLRALFFDDKPILISFLEDHGIDIKIEALETNVSFLLMSQLEANGTHISDFLIEILLSPEMRASFPLDEEKRQFYWHQEPGAYAAPMRNPERWVPTKLEDPDFDFGVTHVTGGGPSQYFSVTRRKVSAIDWGRVGIGSLKTISIDRRNLACYVANKVGGVHYDSRRLPSGAGDKEQFKILATAYDWDNQAVMHGGFVAVGLACVELLASRDVLNLLNQLEHFYTARQNRLLEERSDENLGA